MSEFGGLGKHENTAHTKKEEKRMGSAILWLLAFPEESSLNFPCTILGQENYLIQSNSNEG